MRRKPTLGRRWFLVEPLEERTVLSVSFGPLSSTFAAYQDWTIQSFSVDDLEIADSSFSLDSQTQTGNVGAYDSQMLNLIGATQARNEFSYRGTGYSVAVIDTGVDYRHAALSGRVLPGWDFVNNDADPMDDHGHGTHVAGIIASADATYGGVAPDVNIIPLKVLAANGSGSFAAVESALQWVIANRTRYNIVAVNMSLGAGNFASNPYTFLEDEFSSLVSSGVFIASAAGNSYYTYGSTQGLGYPAISNQVVAVGAVYDANVGATTWSSGARDYTTAADRIASFSQRSALLDLLAPGALITSTARGGGFVTMAGTSMASPVVAGAAALLHQALDAVGRSAQANQTTIYSIMAATGVTVIDGDDENDNVTNTGLAFRRLNLLAALQSIGSPAPTPAPTDPALSLVDTVSTFDAGLWTLAVGDKVDSPISYVSTTFGKAGDQAVIGDWNGDGFENMALYRNGTWYLDANGSFGWQGPGAGDRSGTFGIAGDVAVVGDWNGNGKANVGVFRSGVWFFDMNESLSWDAGDIVCGFGTAGDIPVVGDWNGDGKDEIGVFRNGTWILDTNGNRSMDGSDPRATFGAAGDRPFVGDFDGDGEIEIAYYRTSESRWYYDADHSLSSTGGDTTQITSGLALTALVGRWKPAIAMNRADLVSAFDDGTWTISVREKVDSAIQTVTTTFGKAGDQAVAGDWNGDGYAEMGIFRNGNWYLDSNSTFGWNGVGGGDRSGYLGLPGDVAVVGDWDGDGRDNVGVFRRGVFYIDMNNNLAWDAGDLGVAFGNANDIPVIGDWNGDGRDDVGVYRNGTWFLDWNGSRFWDAADRSVAFGTSTDVPFVGDFNGDRKIEIAYFRPGENRWYYDSDRSFSSTSADIVSAPSSLPTHPVIGRWRPTIAGLSSASESVDFVSQPIESPQPSSSGSSSVIRRALALSYTSGAGSSASAATTRVSVAAAPPVTIAAVDGTAESTDRQQAIDALFADSSSAVTDESVVDSGESIATDELNDVSPADDWEGCDAALAELELV